MAELEKTGSPSDRVRLVHILVLGGLSAVAPLSTDLYLPALPALGRELGSGMAQVQVTLSAGILGLALGQLVSGPASDALGRRRPLLLGLAVFVLASLMCAFAPSVETLVALRFVQGFAGAAGVAIALASVTDLYVGVTQARVFSLLTQVSGLAPIVAPVLGSQLLLFTSWRGVFMSLAVLGVILLAAAAFGLGETLPAHRRRAGGVAALLRASGGLLAQGSFLQYALTCGLAFAVGIVYISASPFVLQTLYDLSPQATGIVLGANALGLVLAARASGRLVGRYSPRTLLVWGAAAMALGGLGLLCAVLGGLGLVGVLVGLFIAISSLGIIAPNATALALSNTTAAGTASAMLGVLQLGIGAIAAPLVGLGGNASATPMAVAVAVFAAATLLVAMSTPHHERREG